MQIRPMEPADAATVASIHNEGIAGRGATFQTWEQTPEVVAGWAASGDRYPVVVADRDGAVVGWARISRYSEFPPYAGVGEVAVYVASGARGGGAGRALLGGLAEAARSRGFHKLIAKVFPANEASIALFRRCGYREVGVHLRHGELDGEWLDVVVLELSL